MLRLSSFHSQFSWKIRIAVQDLFYREIMGIEERLYFVFREILQVETLELLKECSHIIYKHLQWRLAHDSYWFIESGTISQLFRGNDEDGLEFRFAIVAFEPSA